MLTDHDMNRPPGYVAEMIADGEDMGLRKGNRHKRYERPPAVLATDLSSLSRLPPLAVTIL
jgi:hypothetical protein